MSQITSHVLDTSRGLPAAGIRVIFLGFQEDQWIEIATRTTNADGRITDFLEPEIIAQAGTYKLKFQTGEYYDVLSIASLYPYVEIIFQVTGGGHYHIPLLLNPFGYSTYRGS